MTAYQTRQASRLSSHPVSGSNWVETEVGCSAVVVQECSCRALNRRHCLTDLILAVVGLVFLEVEKRAPEETNCVLVVGSDLTCRVVGWLADSIVAGKLVVGIPKEDLIGVIVPETDKVAG